MNVRVRGLTSAAIAISVGLIVLLGYFWDGFSGLRVALLQWGLTLAAVALLVGVFNIFSVHLQKLGQGSGAFHSAILIFTLLSTFSLALLLRPHDPPARRPGPFIQIPV